MALLLLEVGRLLTYLLGRSGFFDSLLPVFPPWSEDNRRVDSVLCEHFLGYGYSDKLECCLRIVRTLLCASLVMAVFFHQDIDGDGDADFADSVGLCSQTVPEGETAWQLPAEDNLSLFLDLASPRVGALLAWTGSGGQSVVGMVASVLLIPDLYTYEQAAARFPVEDNTAGDLTIVGLQGSAFKSLVLTILVGGLVAFLRPLVLLFTGRTADCINAKSAMKTANKVVKDAKTAKKLHAGAAEVLQGASSPWGFAWTLLATFTPLPSLLKELLMRAALWLVITIVPGMLLPCLSLVAVAAADRIVQAATTVRKELLGLTNLLHGAVAPAMKEGKKDA